MEFKKKELGGITENNNSRRIPLNSRQRAERKIDGLYPYFGANNILDYIDEYIFDEKILCIAEDGGNWGANSQCSYIVNEKCWVNNHAHVLKENGEANLEYLRYYLNATNLNKYITGSTRGKLTRRALSKIKIPLPSIENQKRIAQVLTDCETLIAQRKESITLLDELVKSTFLEMFGDPVKNEKGWETKELKKITTKIGSGSTPRGGKEAYKKEGISLIRSLNVYDNFFKYNNLAFIDRIQADKLKNVTIEENDILLNITGASVARVTLVPKEILPARVNQHVSILRAKLNELSPNYASHLLSSENFKKYLINIATLGGATREALTKSQVEGLKIPLAPIELQNEFTQIVEKVEETKIVYQSHLTALENLYARISQDAFKGKLDVSKVVLREELSESDVTVTTSTSTTTTTTRPKPYGVGPKPKVDTPSEIIKPGKDDFKKVNTKKKKDKSEDRHYYHGPPGGKFDMDFTPVYYPEVDKDGFIKTHKDYEREFEERQIENKRIKKEKQVTIKEYDSLEDEYFQKFMLQRKNPKAPFTYKEIMGDLNGFTWNAIKSDVDYSAFKEIIFEYISDKKWIQQIFDESDGQLKLQLTDEAFTS